MLKPQDATRSAVAEEVLTDRLHRTYETLRMLRDQYSPNGSLTEEAFWERLSQSHSTRNVTFEAVKQLSLAFGNGTWEGLDQWIKDIEGDCNAVDAMIRLNFDKAGQEVPEVSRGRLLQQVRDGAAAREAIRYFGPNWHRAKDSLNRMCGQFGTSQKISSELVSQSLTKKASSIMTQYKQLRGVDQDGLLDLFQQVWSSLSKETRRAYLKTLPTVLHEFPNAHIQHFVTDHEHGSIGFNPQAYKKATLNMHDLCHGDNLPRMLQSRATHHPRHFIWIDARASNLGMWCGSLRQIYCRGGLGIDEHNDEEYRVVINLDGSTSTPGLLFHELEAQSHIYTFLLQCTDLERLARHKESIGNTISSEDGAPHMAPSLSMRMAAMDHSPATKVDLAHLYDLVKASGEEAMDELFQLRSDAEYWSIQMDAQVVHGRSSSLLTSTFHRIALFTEIESLLKDIIERSGSVLCPSPDNPACIQDCIAVETAFKTALEGTYDSLRPLSAHLSDLPKDCIRLLDLLINKDPVVWVIGFPSVLRYLDDALSERCRAGELPPMLMQKLNDMSLLAYSLTEAQKYAWVTRSNQLVQTDIWLDEIEDRWTIRLSPWKNLVDNALQVLDRRTSLALDGIFRRSHLSLATRHQRFWAQFDALMNEISKGTDSRSSFDTMQRTAPLTHVFDDFRMNPAAFLESQAEPSPSRTRISKSKRATMRRSSNASKSLVTVEHENRTPTKRQLRISRGSGTMTLKFWDSLFRAENETFTWKQFCAAMSGIGFSITPQGGSGYRFELAGDRSCALVFHQPHKVRDPVTMRQARSWWLRRILTRFDLSVNA
ncbi:Hypothetical protein D9617_15g042210 [Elsinoe fawcettii]|nr:Hypothetical protein D9617_15g042210 [Elsinoe fawcettii]